MDVKIEPGWKAVLQEEFSKPYFERLATYIKEEVRVGKIIYPPGKFIFNAFRLCPFEQVKVVIIGQDPYHGRGQAHGLCFSVPDGVALPPSLRNIYEEIHHDLGTPVPHTGDLSHWARQGVLLLNASLTVRAHEANSHAKIGWSYFTDAVIRQLSAQKQGLVFLLWGRFAQEKAAFIDSSRHHLLKAAHPSPFSAHNGFFGCRHFSKANAYLTQHGQKPIIWAP